MQLRSTRPKLCCVRTYNSQSSHVSTFLRHKDRPDLRTRTTPPSHVCGTGPGPRSTDSWFRFYDLFVNRGWLSLFDGVNVWGDVPVATGPGGHQARNVAWRRHPRTWAEKASDWYGWWRQSCSGQGATSEYIHPLILARGHVMGGMVMRCSGHAEEKGCWAATYTWAG